MNSSMRNLRAFIALWFAVRCMQDLCWRPSKPGGFFATRNPGGRKERVERADGLFDEDVKGDVHVIVEKRGVHVVDGGAQDLERTTSGPLRN